LTDPTSRTPLVLYTFEEGSGTTVRDVSGSRYAAEPHYRQWCRSDLERIRQPDDQVPDHDCLQWTGHQAVSVLKASNALTLEAWFKPANTTQAGPARIVSLSQDLNLRNLTLGQESVQLRHASADHHH
jgi:hypothetical protein